jgi:uncharacterized membrane protein
MRRWEVDALRGVAIVEMIFYHFVWDAHYFGLYQGNIYGPTWQLFPRNIATLFLLVMGVSLTLSHSRRPGGFGKYLARGATILGLGLMITVGTYFFIGRGFVLFGILHLLGLCVILAYPFLGQSKWASLGAGLPLIGVGVYLNTLSAPYPWLIWLGIPEQGRAMVDYYPLLPWFGVALLGLFAGRSLYREGEPRFSLPAQLDTAVPIRGLRFLGRHSLLIYMIHQPILMAGFMVFAYL